MFGHSSSIPTVVSSIFLATDKELGMEELAICSRPDLVNWLQSTIRVSPLRESPNTKIRTDGSRSTKMDRGTYFPLLVSVKKVSKEPPSVASLASGSGRPSAFRPCSRRYLHNKSEPKMLKRRAFKGEIGFLTVPRHCYRAGCRPGQYGGGRSMQSQY